MRSKNIDDIADALALAYVEGEHEFVRNTAVPAFLQPACDALRTCLAVGRGECGQQEALTAIDAGLASQPSVSLQLVLLRIASLLHAYTGQLQHAARALAAIDALPMHSHPSLAVVPAITRWRLARLQADDAAAYQALSSISLEKLTAGSRAWCDVVVSTVQTCIEQWRFREADDFLQRLTVIDTDLCALGFAPRGLLAAFRALEGGDYHTAARLLQRLVAHEQASSPGLIAEVSLCVDLGLLRLDQITRRLHAWRTEEHDPAFGVMRLQLDEMAALSIRAEAALLANDARESYKIVSDMQPKLPRDQRACDIMRAEALVCLGDYERAQRVIDSWPDSVLFLGTRCRLAHAQGASSVVQQHMLALHQRGGFPLLLRALRFDQTLTPAALAAVIPVSSAALGPSDRGTEQPRRNTHQRRRAMRALFIEFGSLTRSELVRRLQVAPGTVTSDLKYFVAEGLIQRVSPSRSSRSDYFIWQAGDSS